MYTDIYKDGVADLILSIQNEEFGIPITIEQQPDLNEISKYYQVDNGNFWIAKIGDKVIGTIALLDIGNNKSALRKMFVAKDYRGKEFGIGQTLLNKESTAALSKRRPLDTSFAQCWISLGSSREIKSYSSREHRCARSFNAEAILSR